MFIDDIIKHKDVNSPGAGNYESPKTFGKVGVNYSMASLLRQEEKALNKSTKLPGPGSYSHAQITGMLLTQSQYQSVSKYSFGKANMNDRFEAPTKKVAAPSPAAYNPLTNFNENYNATFNQAA